MQQAPPTGPPLGGPPPPSWPPPPPGGQPPPPVSFVQSDVVSYRLKALGVMFVGLFFSLFYALRMMASHVHGHHWSLNFQGDSLAFWVGIALTGFIVLLTNELRAGAGALALTGVFVMGALGAEALHLRGQDQLHAAGLERQQEILAILNDAGVPEDFIKTPLETIVPQDHKTWWQKSTYEIFTIEEELDAAQVLSQHLEANGIPQTRFFCDEYHFKFIHDLPEGNLVLVTIRDHSPSETGWYVQLESRSQHWGKSEPASDQAVENCRQLQAN